jgi:beta-N-acetylhexosaminidase
MSDDELDRRVHALLLPGFVGHRAPDWLRRRVDAGLGGVVLFSRNVGGDPALRGLTDDLHARRPDLLVAVDEEGGDVTRIDAARGSRHPGAYALGRIDDEALTRRVGASIGALLDLSGVDWCWAPVVDVTSNPENPVIGVRSYGTDAELVARHAAAAVRGLQDDAGIIACAKHFPGHGDTSTDSHLDLPVVDATLDDLERIALAPFRACIEADVRSIMTAHLRVLALDPAQPATISPLIVTGLLRKRLGYDGVVVSDALEMAGIVEHCGLEEGAVRAVVAGVDALCLGGHLSDDDVVERVRATIVSAVRSGRLDLARVVEASDRMATLADWRATRAAGAVTVMTDAECRSAAERTTEVVGDVRLPDGTPCVITCDPVPLVAAGVVPWGLAGPISERRPGTVEVQVTSGSDIHDALGAAHGRPLVLVLRDSGRYAWQRDLVARARVRRPDCVVVEMGLPPFSGSAPAPSITTYGASQAAVERVVALLLGAESA